MKESAFTIGVDYERRLTRLLGFGGVVEFADKRRDHILIATVDLHFGRFKLQTGPGFERREGPDGTEGLGIFRVGATYDYFFDRFSLSPVINVDFVEGEQVYVYGVNFGWGF